MVLPFVDANRKQLSSTSYVCLTRLPSAGAIRLDDSSWPGAPVQAWRQKAIIGRMSGLRMSAIWNPSQELARGQEET